MRERELGIDALHFYTPHYYLSLEELAYMRGVDPQKYLIGIGQKEMSIAPPNEDVITMGANAALPLLSSIDKQMIDTLFFATESAIDQAKSGANFVHRLLNLPSRCRVIELKQACYSATAALRFGLALLAQQPDKKMLVIASDIARYRLYSPEEPTQGAGAVAFILSSHPRLLSIDSHAGLYTEDSYDFWRPNHRREALVSKCSVNCYLHALEKAWMHYRELSPLQLTDFSHFCYHQPFKKMVEKAHLRLAKMHSYEQSIEKWLTRVNSSTIYSQRIGNSYTASLYIGLISLLENEEEDLSEKQVGFFSYGSGCMGEFFSGKVVPNYRKYLYGKEHLKQLSGRNKLKEAEYLHFYHHSGQIKQEFESPEREKKYETETFVLENITEEQRMYRRKIHH